MATVYIETSIVSHATARPSSDPNIAALQIQAREWWRLERPKFDLVTSQLVIREVDIVFLDRVDRISDRLEPAQHATFAGA